MNDQSHENNQCRTYAFTADLSAFSEKRVRVDRYLAIELPHISRSAISSSDTVICVNEIQVRKSRTVNEGDKITVQFSLPNAISALPQNIPLKVIYKDNNVLVIDKEQGMVVHPGAGNREGTVANALAYITGSNPGTATDEESQQRPGIVHRLDKDTSGVLITALNQKSLMFLSNQFKNRVSEKIYTALVKGVPYPQEGWIRERITRDRIHRKRFTVTENPVKGKDAITFYRVLRSFQPAKGNTSGYSLVRLEPKTGRTHQLRVHMKHAGHPILGDPIYSRADALFPDATLMLHAFSLTVRIPTDKVNRPGSSPKGEKDMTGAEPERGDPQLRRFTAPLPDRFRTVLRRLLSLDGGGA